MTQTIITVHTLTRSPFCHQLPVVHNWCFWRHASQALDSGNSPNEPHWFLNLHQFERLHFDNELLTLAVHCTQSECKDEQELVVHDKETEQSFPQLKESWVHIKRNWDGCIKSYQTGWFLIPEDKQIDHFEQRVEGDVQFFCQDHTDIVQRLKKQYRFRLSFSIFMFLVLYFTWSFTYSVLLNLRLWQEPICLSSWQPDENAQTQVCCPKRHLSNT